MPRFRRRITEVDAEQWFPGKEVKGVCHVDGRHVVMTAHNQIVVLAPGDWVTAESNGQGFYPIKPKIFEELYEPI